MLFKVSAPHIDANGTLSYCALKRLYKDDLSAVKRAKALGGRVLAIDGANNRLLDDFWAGSEAESQLEALLKAERKTFKVWKAEHNCAQVFH